MANPPLVIKQRGEDGTRVISLRIKETILAQIDVIASQTNRSRNEIVSSFIEYALKNVEIENSE